MLTSKKLFRHIKKNDYIIYNHNESSLDNRLFENNFVQLILIITKLIY